MSNQQAPTQETVWICSACGCQNDADAGFCSNCGARNSVNETQQNEFPQNPLQAQPYSENAGNGFTQNQNAPVKTKSRKKGLIIGIACGAAVLAGLAVFLIIMFKSSKPTFVGKTTHQELISAAQQYVNTDEFKHYGNVIRDYTVTEYNGKLGNYYQFNIVGTKHNIKNGQVTTFTEDDNIVVVLTETAAGITQVDAEKWLFENEADSSDYETNTINTLVTRVSYDYSTGNLWAYVRIQNGYQKTCTINYITLVIYDKNENVIAEGSFNINSSLGSNSYSDWRIDFNNGRTYAFLDDLSEIKMERKSRATF